MPEGRYRLMDGVTSKSIVFSPSPARPFRSRQRGQSPAGAFGNLGVPQRGQECTEFISRPFDQPGRVSAFPPTPPL